MGFKPMTKYFAASEISEKKAYETIKHRANGLSKEKAYNILAFMGFKPMTFGTKYVFHLTKYQKTKPSKFRLWMGFKPMIKYFTAFEISQKKAYKI